MFLSCLLSKKKVDWRCYAQVRASRKKWCYSKFLTNTCLIRIKSATEHTENKENTKTCQFR